MKKILFLVFLIYYGFGTVAYYRNLRSFISPQVIISLEKQFNISKKEMFTIYTEIENFGGINLNKPFVNIDLFALLPNSIFTSFNFGFKYNYFFSKRNENFYFSTLLNFSLLLKNYYPSYKAEGVIPFYDPVYPLYELGYRLKIKKSYFVDLFFNINPIIFPLPILLIHSHIGFGCRVGFYF